MSFYKKQSSHFPFSSLPYQLHIPIILNMSLFLDSHESYRIPVPHFSSIDFDDYPQSPTALIFDKPVWEVIMLVHSVAIIGILFGLTYNY